MRLGLGSGLGFGPWLQRHEVGRGQRFRGREYFSYLSIVEEGEGVFQAAGLGQAFGAGFWVSQEGQAEGEMEAPGARLDK